MGVLLVPALRVVNAHVGENLQHRLFRGRAVEILVQLHRLLELFANGF